MVSGNPNFAIIENGRRVWAVSTIHADIRRLKTAHQVIAGMYSPGDYVVYLGNIIGRGEANLEAVQEIISFQSRLSLDDVSAPESFVFLRGANEEMWSKMLQLQFANKPEQVYGFMLKNGMDSIIRSYGYDPEEGRLIVEKGAVAISKWMNELRSSFYAKPGYNEIFLKLKHYAKRPDHRLLFVHSWLDTKQPLEKQTDEFWWGSPDGFAQEKPYRDFRMVVRGYSRGTKGGIYKDDYYLTLHSGTEYGGPLYVALFDESGVLDKAAEI